MLQILSFLFVIPCSIYFQSKCFHSYIISPPVPVTVEVAEQPPPPLAYPEDINGYVLVTSNI